MSQKYFKCKLFVKSEKKKISTEHNLKKKNKIKLLYEED